MTKLAENLYYIGVMNPALRVFDIIMNAKYGTTYNAYLLTGSKNVLVETVHERFFDEYIANLRAYIDPAKIDYLVMNHTEPDHSGAIAKLLDINPNVTVVATAGGHKFIAQIINKPYKSMVVKQGDELELGDEKLKFIIAPMLHWPDSMFSWHEASGTLFTCDFLGAHYCEPRKLDTYVTYPQIYAEQFRYYYDCIFGPFKPYVLQGLDKIAGLPAARVAVSHGPVLESTIAEKVELYRKWSEPKQRNGILIAYASSYGYTAKLARAAAEELGENDIALLDLVTASPTEAAEAFSGAAAVLLGSCTINRDAPKPVWDLLSMVDQITNAGKPIGVFGSYGWTGEAVGMICARLGGLKLNVIGEPVRCVFQPTENDLVTMKAYARQVVNAV